MTFEQTMHTIEDDSIWGEYERLAEENNRLLALQADYDRLLARNNQLLIENAELEKRIEELE